MNMPQVGDIAPAFQLPDQNGNTVSLAQFAGRNVVLYFYPKDDTPGCTKEACHFRDEHSALEKLGAVVLGVSPDSTKSHQKFASKYGLPFSLLADEGHRIAEQYGVWVEKSRYGRRYMGINRATFLIGPDGTVKHSWPNVKVENHVNEVLEMLQGRGADERSISEMNELPEQETSASEGETQTVGEAVAEVRAVEPAPAPRARKSPARKAAKKGAVKKAAGKKTAAKKGAAKKTATKKTAAKKAAGKKTAAKKGAAKKAATKKTAAKKTAAKKGAAKKAAKKTVAKKSTAKKAAAKKSARKTARR